MRPVFSVGDGALLWAYDVAAVFPSCVWVVDDWLCRRRDRICQRWSKWKETENPAVIMSFPGTGSWSRVCEIEILHLLLDCFWCLSLLWCCSGFLCFCNRHLTLCVQRAESRTTDQNHTVSPKCHRWPNFTSLLLTSAGYFFIFYFFYIIPLKYAWKTEVLKPDIECKMLFSQEKMSVKHVGTPSALDSKSDHIQMWNWSNCKICVWATRSSLVII